MDKYTTQDKILAIDDKDLTAKTAEEAKTIISNDAYAVADLIKQLIDKVEHARLSLI
jgi:hypothetical protein